jgi:hypothetical protein
MGAPHTLKITIIEEKDNLGKSSAGTTRGKGKRFIESKQIFTLFSFFCHKQVFGKKFVVFYLGDSENLVSKKLSVFVSSPDGFPALQNVIE